MNQSCIGRAQATIDELETVQAFRVLTDVESALLERSLRRLGPKRDIWRWSAKDDRRLKLLIKKRGYSLRIKPFERNDEVQRIAQDMGRSYRAVLKRIQYVRLKMEYPNLRPSKINGVRSQCPNASNMRKG